MTALAFSSTGAVRTPPTVVEKGLGVYQITPSDSDESERTIILVDTGAGNLPRRYTFAASRVDGSNQFWAWHLEDSAGAPWTGAPPTIAAGSYVDAAGAPRAPPGLLAVAGAYLWALIPTPADLAADVSVRIDPPAGSSSSYLVGSTEAVNTGPSGPFTPPRTGAILRSGDGIAPLR
jgi:hypothetical protein